MKTVIILFVFILGARPRKPFQSQLFELSLRQRIGSMVSRTRLNLRRLYISLCLFLHLFSNFFIQGSHYIKDNRCISLSLQAVYL